MTVPHSKNLDALLSDAIVNNVTSRSDRAHTLSYLISGFAYSWHCLKRGANIENLVNYTNGGLSVAVFRYVFLDLFEVLFSVRCSGVT